MPRADIDEAAAEELELYIENDGDLHRQQHQPIIKNLMAKRGRGEYSEARAVDAFMYLVENGAKKYHQEHGTPGRPWHETFTVPTRRLVAQNLAKTFKAEAELGNYDQLLPKKYQKSPGPKIAMPSDGWEPDDNQDRIAAENRSARAGRKTKAQLESDVRAYLGAPPTARRRRAR